MSTVDVVIPCYRYGRFLRQAVDSVLDQAVDVRILIVDDCSPDDSGDEAERIADKDRRISVRRHQVNRGHIATYNEGIDWASGNYFLLLSADDYLLPGALVRATRLLDERPEVGFAFGDALELDQCGQLWPMRPLDGRYPVSGDVVLDSRLFCAISRAMNIVPTPTAVVRTALQKQLGGYRADLPHSGDMEMWWRFASAAGVGFIDAQQAVYRRHGANMSTAYEVRHRLPDLVQRRDALRHVMRRPGTDAILGAALRRDIAATLSTEAVNCASKALNDADSELAKELLRFAEEEWPAIKFTWPWIKVAGKQALGTRACGLAARLRARA